MHKSSIEVNLNNKDAFNKMLSFIRADLGLPANSELHGQVKHRETKIGFNRTQKATSEVILDKETLKVTLFTRTENKTITTTYHFQKGTTDSKTKLHFEERQGKANGKVNDDYVAVNSLPIFNAKSKKRMKLQLQAMKTQLEK